MPQCPFCKIPSDQPICIRCGHSITAARRRCSKCGQMSPTTEPTCVQCHARFVSEWAWKVPLIILLVVLAMVVPILIELLV